MLAIGINPDMKLGSSPIPIRHSAPTCDPGPDSASPLRNRLTVEVGTGPKSSASQQVRRLSWSTTDATVNAVDLPGMTHVRHSRFMSGAKGHDQSAKRESRERPALLEAGDALRNRPQRS